MEERIESLSRPGAKETEERYTRLGAVRATCAATDFARDDQRAHTAFRQVIVRWNLWHRHEDEQLG